ncbi:alpha/beta fold hydrolase [Hymenobacter jeollabukensis]|uniref:Alpha/beta hydrolase n=1 Tax=Hymenobacter jeollabukensis TaxID=2025313 RepID=A0A5R8WSY0_9BACT|nr:alpha/beta hydrolase [Hymenobacter jeollabukensis]TLM94304.1 alpha/beta hydrolase [Hymenobacter jeollabukensis]
MPLRCLWLLPTLVLLVMARPLRAQPTKFLSPVVGASIMFQQKVSLRAYAGKPCRLSARMRVDTAQVDGGDARIGLLMFDAKKRILGGLNMGNKPARSAAWQTYTVQGPLAKQVDSVGVVGIQYLNGTFEYDDFKLEVETQPGQWQRVELRNAGFEHSAPGPNTGLPTGWKSITPVVGFGYEVAETAPGQRILRVTGRGIVRYGRNARAGHYATVNGVKLYYETYGQGEPLLLLHGNGESIQSFANQIGALAEHYRVIAVDTRGHGRSGNEKRAYTYDLFADDMRALLDTLGIGAAHVVGWSDGGNTGLSLATRYPTRVLSLVTMGANLYCDKTAVEAKTLREVRLIHAAGLVLGPFKPNFRRARRLSTLLLKYPQMQPAQLGAVQVPTLVLAGENDVILEPHSRLIASNIKGSQLHIFPGLTHYAPQEDRTRFNEVVLGFLQQLPPAGGKARRTE